MQFLYYDEWESCTEMSFPFDTIHILEVATMVKKNQYIFIKDSEVHNYNTHSPPPQNKNRFKQERSAILYSYRTYKQIIQETKEERRSQIVNILKTV